VKFGSLPTFAGDGTGSKQDSTIGIREHTQSILTHDEIFQHMSMNEEWPVRLTFVCPPVATHYRMTVTGKIHDTTTRQDVRDGKKYAPTGRGARREFIAGYERGVECDVVLGMGAVEITPIAFEAADGDGAPSRRLDLSGGTLLEFSVEESCHQAHAMSGIRLCVNCCEVGAAVAFVEFDFKVESGADEGSEEEYDDLVKRASVFKRAVDHANADLDWSDIYRQGKSAGQF
jgi:hypothetical protein